MMSQHHIIPILVDKQTQDVEVRLHIVAWQQSVGKFQGHHLLLVVVEQARGAKGVTQSNSFWKNC